MTILGGMEEPSRILMDVSCIVIKRTVNQYRSQVFRNLLSCGFKKIVSVESFNAAFNTETLSLDFPEIKFVRAHGRMSDGALVNLGMGELDSPYALVVHDDLCVQDFKFSRSLAQKLSDFNAFCVAARLLNSDRQGVPVRFTPKVKNSVFDVETSLAVVDKAMTLYPLDLAGFYDVNAFKMLGGFDYTIESPYWQEMDLFFRAWLWGEKIQLSSAFTLGFFDEVPVYDRTADISYLKFFLKNLLPSFKRDHGEISIASFPSFKARSRCGMNEALTLFNAARDWVKLNRFRFKTDAASLLEGWGKELDA
ncbi:MAG: hypothetical protein IJU95_02645 [Treponema sp.]|nr:hypothetical protein [Treponema sp.]